ncbi:MAG: phosphatidylserine decarboxylase [Thermoplasmata archaeon]
MIARGGRLFVLLSAAAAVALFPVNVYACVGFACLTGFLVFVFRDPSRRAGEGIVAPADGTVREVDREKGLVSIYLALINVHVTRAPLEGVVSKLVRHPGKHVPAFSRRSPNNERVELAMDTGIGTVLITHISGILARRIVPYVDKGHSMDKADRLGLIRFGSRVDLVMPPDRVDIKVEVGQRLRAGVTCVAEVSDDRAG